MTTKKKKKILGDGGTSLSRLLPSFCCKPFSLFLRLRYTVFFFFVKGHVHFKKYIFKSLGDRKKKAIHYKIASMPFHWIKFDRFWVAKNCM